MIFFCERNKICFFQIFNIFILQVDFLIFKILQVIFDFLVDRLK